MPWIGQGVSIGIVGQGRCPSGGNSDRPALGANVAVTVLCGHAYWALALRQAIWRKEDPRWHVCGIPEVLYSDNGSDFTSQHLDQVSADLKIQLVFSTPGVPRGRGRIERFFATLAQMCLCDLPGYSPPKGAMRGKPTLTLNQLDSLLRSFFVEIYNRRTHSETRIPPSERWEAGGFLPRMPDSLEKLDLLLLTVARQRKVQSDGVRYQGLRYIGATLAAYMALR
jgi:putative transposase